MFGQDVFWVMRPDAFRPLRAGPRNFPFHFDRLVARVRVCVGVGGFSVLGKGDLEFRVWEFLCG